MLIGFEEEGIAQTPDGRTTCLKCLRTFSTAHNAERHYRSQHMTTEKVPCRFCQRAFKNKYSLNEHLRQHHGITQSMLKARIVVKPGPDNLSWTHCRIIDPEYNTLFSWKFIFTPKVKGSSLTNVNKQLINPYPSYSWRFGVHPKWRDLHLMRQNPKLHEQRPSTLQPHPCGEPTC